ncbi:MAG TPA: thiamine-phosphate kinase [Thermoanaerobaculia bacterium]|nr:thiamine-phosphate kinase [Thermoanaerobaculia bacterium]HQN06730.1 thiamine-phosphate kinase [Thermoanaerobaculia bacterium]HQP86372.1 thiamine-phosphate kinase [Thermoanaerobaculia bacterium]
MKTLPPETDLLRSFERLFATRRRDVRVGVGDDAAVLAAPSSLAVSTDALVEGEDFTGAADPYLVGRKAMNVNLSDLAAMGATPLHALLTLGLPRETPVAWLDGFLDGFRAAAREQAVAIVGGDLTAARERFASVTVLGRVSEEGPLRRGGGGPGDELWVSGTLGAAAAGLSLVLRGYRRDRDGKVTAPRGRRVSPARRDEIARLLRHQLDPRPMVDLGRALAEGGIASAAIDLSDGLARDLHRLCRASGTGAVVETATLPVDSGLPALAELPTSPLDLALFGGEDYGLLFAVPPERLGAMKKLAARFAVRRIGRLDGTSKVLLAEGGAFTSLPDRGFDHFAGPTG